MTRTAILFVFVLSTSFLFASCTKTGPQGEQGMQGPAGANGNANIWVDTLTIQDAQWKYSVNEATYGDSAGTTTYGSKSVILSVSEITAGIIDSGTVQVSFIPAPEITPTDWQPLPFQFPGPSGTVLVYDYVVAQNKLTLYIYYMFIGTAYPNINTYHPGAHQFKIVVASGHL